MYSLVALSPKNLTDLKSILENHILHQGTEAIAKCCTTDAANDPKTYVQTILDVHKKYNALVLTAFNNDNGFVAALDKACGKFINSNVVTIANSASKSPELLAKYCDLLLKKSSKNPEDKELEDNLNQVMVVNSKNGLSYLHETTADALKSTCEQVGLPKISHFILHVLTNESMSFRFLSKNI